ETQTIMNRHIFGLESHQDPRSVRKVILNFQAWILIAIQSVPRHTLQDIDVKRSNAGCLSELLEEAPVGLEMLPLLGKLSS
ncbi:hypothetical protein N9C16_11685, partial [Paracoccaceae bacterium]|nr:hypothetical protein [Paracoccaceae bacterium]